MPTPFEVTRTLPYYAEPATYVVVGEQLTAPGTELIVQWGDHGGRIKDVRATVDRFPLLSEDRNSEVRSAA